MLFHYVRDEHNQKIGIVVALDRDIIGWSRCKTKLDQFDKSIGFAIAIGRAKTCNEIRLNRQNPPRDVQKVIEQLKERARRYFKEEVIVNSATKKVPKKVPIKIAKLNNLIELVRGA